MNNSLKLKPITKEAFDEYKRLYETDEYIKIPDLKHGYIYKLFSRNLKLGVYHKERNGFIGIRLKFRSLFLFMEHHWDNKDYATAKPLEEIGKLPEHIPVQESVDGEHNNELFHYLEKLEENSCQ